jgi:hypothetical protein
MLSKQVDWKRLFHSMAPKITRPNTTGLFSLGLCEEYHLSGENCRSLNSAAVTELILVNAWHEMECHFDVDQGTDGAYIKTY